MKYFIPFNKFHSHWHPRWFTSTIRHKIKCLRTLHRKFAHHPSPHLASKIESLNLTLQLEITQAKLNFESTLINNFTQVNSNKIYGYIKSITKSKSLPATIHLTLI